MPDWALHTESKSIPRSTQRTPRRSRKPVHLLRRRQRKAKSPDRHDHVGVMGTLQRVGLEQFGQFGATSHVVRQGGVMAISLYDLSVANYLQTLSGVITFLEEGLTHFQANNVDLNEIVDTRLHADMFPFPIQIQSVVHHSRGSIEGV